MSRLVFCILPALICSGALLGVVAPAWAQESIPLRIRLGDVSINKVPFVIAYEQGIYRKNGLEIDQFISPGAARFVDESGVAVQGLYIRDEPAPVSIGGGTPLMYARTTHAQSLDRIVLATTDTIVRWPIVARPGITRLEQLKGKRLGFSGVGAMTHMICLELCRRMGWDSRFDLSLMGGGASVEALEKGWVDAFVAGEIPYAMALKAGYKPLIDLRSWDMPIAGSSVQTTASWVRENREAARRLMRSLVEAIAVMKQDKAAAFQAMEKWYNVTDREQQEVIYAGAAEMPRKPYPSIEGIRKTMELYDSHEMRKHKPEDFYDDSFVRELDESGFIDSLYEDKP